MNDHVLWCIGHSLVIKDIVRAKGCCIFDSKGNRYVDMESGVWCVVAGHCNLRINRAIKKQLESIAHTGYCYTHRIVEEASQKVLEVTGLPSGRCVFLCSGSEAVEFGVQLIKKIKDRPKLLTMTDSFLSSYGSSGNRDEKEWHLFDWSGCRACRRSAKCDKNCTRLKKIPFSEIGGFVFEPGSSSGLVNFPPASMIQNIVGLVRKNNGLIQANEITTGFGSTGKWFGFQHYGVKPDIVSMGKRLGNGYPVSAIAMSQDVVSLAESHHFKYSQSHQNDPLGCSATKEVINVIAEKKLVARSEKLGSYFVDRLNNLKKSHPAIKEIRGRGLMIAVEFSDKLDSKQLDSIHARLLEHGFIIARRPGLSTFRIDPPLIITKKQIDMFLKCFEQIVPAL